MVQSSVLSSRTRPCQQKAMAHNVLGMKGNGMVPGDSGSVFISSSQEPSASIQKSGCTTQIHCSYKPLLRNSVAFGKMGMPRVEKLRYRVEMGVWYYNSTELQAIGQTGLTALRRNEEHRAPDSGVGEVLGVQT